MAVRCSESKLHQKVAKLWLDLGGIFIRVEHLRLSGFQTVKIGKLSFIFLLKVKSAHIYVRLL